jgi:hypothetical protein
MKSVIQAIYDIVKAHCGAPIVPIAIGIGIKVESKEGEGSEFALHIPSD